MLILLRQGLLTVWFTGRVPDQETGNVTGVQAALSVSYETMIEALWPQSGCTVSWLVSDFESFSSQTKEVRSKGFRALCAPCLSPYAATCS